MWVKYMEIVLTERDKYQKEIGQVTAAKKKKLVDDKKKGEAVRRISMKGLHATRTGGGGARTRADGGREGRDDGGNADNSKEKEEDEGAPLNDSELSSIKPEEEMFFDELSDGDVKKRIKRKFAKWKKKSLQGDYKRRKYEKAHANSRRKHNNDNEVLEGSCRLFSYICCSIFHLFLLVCALLIVLLFPPLLLLVLLFHPSAPSSRHPENRSYSGKISGKRLCGSYGTSSPSTRTARTAKARTTAPER